MNEIYPEAGLLIVVPAWNESESIGATLRALLNLYQPNQLLVIDDGSTDNTNEIAIQFRVHVIKHPFNLGVGAAIRTGYKYALAHGFTKVVHFDADLQHRPEEIRTLLSVLPGNDIVIGSRFKNGSNYKMSLLRKSASKVISKFISKRTKSEISDVTSGFRASSQNAITLFASSYPTEYLADTVESLVLAHDKGLKIVEVATPMDQRFAGEPSHGIWKSTLHLFRAVLVIISTLKKPKLISRRSN